MRRTTNLVLAGLVAFSLAGCGSTVLPQRSDDNVAPTDDPSDSPVSGFPTRPAGDGTIVETGDQGPPGMESEFLWRNEWWITLGDQVVSAYAGARTSDPTRGVVFVSVWNADQSQLLSSELLETSNANGSVRFVDGNGATATLLADDGAPYLFDAETLTLRPSPP